MFLINERGSDMDWVKWLLILLPNLLASTSPDLRRMLTDFAKTFKEAAKKTANPWDDFIAELICWATGVNG